MLRKSLYLNLLFVVILCVLACPAGQNSFVQTAETTKTVAEDIMYYARVYQNLGKITDTQFLDVKKSYDLLYVAQNQMIDARIAYLKLPSDATAEQKYRQGMTQVVLATQALTQLALKYGIVSGTIPNVPIRN
jgi:hypothetical protein